MKTYGILLVYSAEWRDRAEAEFRRFVAKVGRGDAEVLVVNNGPHLRPGDIPGDNSNQEFSGWDVGLAKIRVHPGDFVFLANDTFCTRNPWSVFVRRRFARGFRKAIERGRRPVMIGAVSAFGGKYSILGDTADFWIRTHIFGMTGLALMRFGRVGLSQTALRDLLKRSGCAETFCWADDVSVNLQSRVDEWLFPVSKRCGWYRAHTADPEVKLRKARAIVNEKWLSAHATTLGIEVIDCGPGLVQQRCAQVFFNLRQLVRQLAREGE